MQKVIPIVFAFDSKLEIPACVCISSLLMNAQSETFYDIFILHSIHENIDTERLEYVVKKLGHGRLTYKKVGTDFDKAFQIRGINTVAYYRLLIPQLIPEYDKIVYSDVDVIFRCDLADVYYKTNLDSYYLAGVNAMWGIMPDMKKYCERRLKINPSKCVYSGNLILNSKKIREDGLIDKFKMHAKKQYRFQDMDILNIVCEDKIAYMPPMFCLTTYIGEFYINKRRELKSLWSIESISEALKIGIVHYNGYKPWSRYCLNFDIWWEYYRKSPVFDEKFYFDFYYYRLNELDQLPLLKRIKVLARWFVYGRRVI